MSREEDSASPLLVNPAQDQDSFRRDGQDRPIDWWKLLIQPCLAEFVGTMLFVFVGVYASFDPDGIVNVALGHAFALFALISVTAAISGGHLNPAVSLGVFLSGALAPGVALGYVVSQLAGGVVGAALTRGLTNYTIKTINGTDLHTFNPFTLNGKFANVGEAIGIEIFLTCILVLTVLTVAVDTKGKNQMAPLAIGLSVGAGILAGGNLSGASMNPARSFGPAVAFWKFDYLYIYFVGPPVGAVLAALIYRFVLSTRKLPIPIYSSFKRRKNEV